MTARHQAPRRERPPTHPGELVREILEEHYGLTIAEAARRLRISRGSLQAALSGRASLKPELALRLGRLFGKPPELWLRMQQACDLWEAERRLAAELRQI